jgi:hypothetical protein
VTTLANDWETMTSGYNVLEAWLESREWLRAGNVDPDIPQQVCLTLKAFIDADNATEEELDWYQESLSRVFTNYKRSARENRAWLQHVVIKLSTFSKHRFFRQIYGFVNIEPGVAIQRLRDWETALDLNARERYQLNFELHMALRG